MHGDEKTNLKEDDAEQELLEEQRRNDREARIQELIHCIQDSTRTVLNVLAKTPNLLYRFISTHPHEQTKGSMGFLQAIGALREMTHDAVS